MGPGQERGLLCRTGVRLRLCAERVSGRGSIDSPRPRWDYGEDRYQLLGAIEGRVFFVAYTRRGTALRIISARKANRREVKEYEKSKSKN